MVNSTNKNNSNKRGSNLNNFLNLKEALGKNKSNGQIKDKDGVEKVKNEKDKEVKDITFKPLTKSKKTKTTRSKNNKVNIRRLIELGLLLAFGVYLLISVVKMGDRAVKPYVVPYTFDDLISKYSKENDLEKELVAALIYQESRFDEDAESHRGALGLMQIMPDTGEWIAGKLDIDYSNEVLRDPETNVKMGTWYLKYLLDYYKGDERLALAAYNAGFGNVDDWMEDRTLYYDGYLHEIPFSETKNYVETIERMKEKYRTSYPDVFKKVIEPKKSHGIEESSEETSN